MALPLHRAPLPPNSLLMPLDVLTWPFSLLITESDHWWWQMLPANEWRSQLNWDRCIAKLTDYGLVSQCGHMWASCDHKLFEFDWGKKRAIEKDQIGQEQTNKQSTNRLIAPLLTQLQEWQQSIANLIKITIDLITVSLSLGSSSIFNSTRPD